ncbi:hypothetical protein DPMN_168691 [Dreissena polymorpha]|uniref:Uncharacterized protein n=1 Tax=Dreissena polymorpha TaxID=45954 RepID=A0A9D4IZK5_DREPO|nr:hypothetical protein DPMN_168691 [Dreissena polymorpha]
MVPVPPRSIYDCLGDRSDVPIERVVAVPSAAKYRLYMYLLVYFNPTLRLRGHTDTELRIQAFEHKCLRKLFHNSFTEQNQRVRSEQD